MTSGSSTRGQEDVRLSPLEALPGHPDPAVGSRRQYGVGIGTGAPCQALRLRERSLVGNIRPLVEVPVAVPVLGPDHDDRAAAVDGDGGTPDVESRGGDVDRFAGLAVGEPEKLDLVASPGGDVIGKRLRPLRERAAACQPVPRALVDDAGDPDRCRGRSAAAAGKSSWSGPSKRVTALVGTTSAPRSCRRDSDGSSRRPGRPSCDRQCAALPRASRPKAAASSGAFSRDEDGVGHDRTTRPGTGSVDLRQGPPSLRPPPPSSRPPSSSPAAARSDAHASGHPRHCSPSPCRPAGTASPRRRRPHPCRSRPCRPSPAPEGRRRLRARGCTVTALVSSVLRLT